MAAMKLLGAGALLVLATYGLSGLMTDVMTDYGRTPTAIQSAAAWVQAIGSIAAIVGAYHLGNRTSRVTLAAVAEGARLDGERRTAGHLAVVEAAASYARELWQAIEVAEPFNLYDIYHPMVTQRLAGALRSIPIYEVGSVDGVKCLLSMSDRFLLLESSLEEYKAGPWQHPGLRKSLETYERPEYRHMNSEREALYRQSVAILGDAALGHLQRIQSDAERVISALSTAR